MRAIDTHAHLNFTDYDDDRSSILTELAASDIGTILVATDFPSIMPIAQLAKDNRLVWGTVGLHPQEMNSEALVRLPQVIDRWKELMAQNQKLVAVGEVGLDYYRLEQAESHYPDADQQKAGLRQLLTFATEENKPVIFHCREAYGDLQTIVADYPKIRGVVHCFDGSAAQAQGFLELGMLISVTAMLTYPKNEVLRAVVEDLPLTSLMIETDSPFLPPQTLRGQRNDPRNVIAVAEAIAELKKTSLKEVLEQTTHNATTFFNLLSPTP